jgi:hypothetical protein
MPRVFLIAFGLLFLSTALTVSALQVGVSQPPPGALVGLDACKLPCWNDIVPRQTPFDTAQALLTEAGYHVRGRGQLFTFEPGQTVDGCQVWLNTGGGYVTVTSLVSCPGVRLGDLLAILGKPEGILRSASGLVFREGQIVIMVRMLPCDEWFSPQSSIHSIYFVDREAMRIRNELATDPIFQSFHWRGFASAEFYHAQDETFPICV